MVIIQANWTSAHLLLRYKHWSHIPIQTFLSPENDVICSYEMLVTAYKSATEHHSRVLSTPTSSQED